MKFANETLALAALLALTSCSQIDTAHWTEEVFLHDGRMIVIERIARAHPRGLLSDSRGADIEFEIHHAPLGIHWKGTKQQDALEVFDGVAYIEVAVGNETEFCKGKPQSTLPIKVLKQQGDQWVEIDPSTFPTKVGLWNLYRGYWGNKPSEDATGLITWEFKSGRDGYPFVNPKMDQPRRARTIDEFFQESKLTCARFQSN